MENSRKETFFAKKQNSSDDSKNEIPSCFHSDFIKWCKCAACYFLECVSSYWEVLWMFSLLLFLFSIRLKHPSSKEKTLQTLIKWSTNEREKLQSTSSMRRPKKEKKHQCIVLINCCSISFCYSIKTKLNVNKHHATRERTRHRSWFKH